MEKKKVGILTFHRADNYGAALQCYALQEVIKSMGHSVEIINYKQPYIENFYKPTTGRQLCKVLKRPRWYYGFFIKELKPQIAKHLKYKYFRARYLNTGTPFSYMSETPCKYSTILIGSDQVWSLHCTGGIDEMFFGEFPHNNCKLVGYGISGNIQSLEEVGDERLAKYCKNFDRLSFREESIKEHIENHINISGTLVLDPTLLLEKNKWEELAKNTKSKKNYVLTYFLHNKSCTPDIDILVEKFAKENGCKLIDIFDVAQSPTEFLSWIKNAQYVITTSYHATIFSIIFEKQFYSIKTNNGHDARYSNLLSKLNIAERAIETAELLNTGSSTIDYTKVKAELSKHKEASLEYLKWVLMTDKP